jgi:hypothetical protein
MPTKKKTQTKKTKTKVKARKKAAVKKSVSARKTAKKAKKKVAKTRARVPKTVTAKRSTASARKKKARQKPRLVALEAAEPKQRPSRSGRLSGDLQGLSTREGADSESVADLVDEGNTFEAEAVAGVEAADLGEGEVHTHEVPEDDVPDEYLDRD